jgi:hypothetical protein
MTVLFICLSTYDNEQSDLAHRISLDKNLEQLPAYKYLLVLFFGLFIVSLIFDTYNSYFFFSCQNRQLLSSFLTSELIVWNQLQTEYKNELEKPAHFAHTVADKDIWNVLRSRVVQHVCCFIHCCF